MNPYIWSGLLSFVANTGIALFVYSRNPREKKNIRFCLFSLSVAGWSAGSFFINIIPDKTAALWVGRANYLFGVWTPALYVQLVYAFNKNTLGQLKKLKFFQACSVLITLLVFTPLFIPSLRVIDSHSFYISQPGIIYYFFFCYFAAAMAEVVFQTIKGLQTKAGLEFRQFKYLAIANALAVIAGFEYFSRVFGLFSTPPIDDYILIADVSILAYAVTRHRLFDIDALVRAFRKERLATLGLLTSSINHEIKNPLYVLKGLLESCLDEGNSKLADKQETTAILEKMHLQTMRITDVLTRFNKLLSNEGKQFGDVERASIGAALDYALEVVSLVDRGKQVDISNQIEKDLGDVCILPGELEEVFINLLINAWQAVPQGGKIVVSASRYGSKVRIKIEDNGVGMPQAQLKNAFKPFNSGKGEKGVGLGLYITKEIIERRGGQLSVKSKESVGTCFEIELLTAIQSNRQVSPLISDGFKI